MPTKIAWAPALLLVASGAVAQETPPATQPTRMDRLEQRLNELEQKYQSDMKTRDEEIHDLPLRALVQNVVT